MSRFLQRSYSLEVNRKAARQSTRNPHWLNQSESNSIVSAGEIASMLSWITSWKFRKSVIYRTGIVGTSRANGVKKQRGNLQCPCDFFIIEMKTPLQYNRAKLLYGPDVSQKLNAHQNNTRIFSARWLYARTTLYHALPSSSNGKLVFCIALAYWICAQCSAWVPKYQTTNESMLLLWLCNTYHPVSWPLAKS